MERTRRAFMGSAAMLAAGAAIGMGGRIKTHGPVSLKADIFGPITFKTILSGDEDRNIFGVLIVTKEAPEINVEMKLSEIRRAVESGSSRVLAKAKNSQGDGELWVDAVRSGARLNFLVAERVGPPTPLWLELADVKRVL